MKRRASGMVVGRRRRASRLLSGVVLAAGLLGPLGAAAAAEAVPASPAECELAPEFVRRQVEEDWLKQAEPSGRSPQSARTPEANSYPTAEVLRRGLLLATDVQAAGGDAGPVLGELDRIAARLKALPAHAPSPQAEALYLEARWVVRRLAFSHPRVRFDKLLFVKRFTQQSYPDVCLNHMPWVSRPGGDICILTNPFSPDGTGQRVRHLLAGALGPGHVHGMDLWFDGDRVVFGYAKAKTDQPPDGWLDRTQSYRLRRTEEPIHLFEVSVDGRNLRQLTDGAWSDLDPTYLPSGQIAFVSERCGTSLQCNEYDKDETSCNLYVMRPDGSGIRRLSVNKDGDYLPHCLDSGLIGYTRWEYHERSWAYIQSLWVVRPDGTGADAIFKQHFVNPWALEDVRSIPGSNKLVAIATGHHTLAVGPLVVIDPSRGMNDPKGIQIVTPGVKPPEGGMDGVPTPEGGVADHGGYYSTPWPLSEKHFLVAYTYGEPTTNPTGYGLYLADVFGNKELIYRDPAISCFIPIPLRARPKPPILPDMTDRAVPYATCAVSNVTYGCEGIAPERARYLRIAEPIGWPYDNTYGGHRYVEDHQCLQPTEEKYFRLNWTPVRVLGDVPIEPDGSAHFRVPADTAVYFQLLDENRMELRRMRSFVSFQPGESRACVGCHETRPAAPVFRSSATLALRRDPSPYMLPPWGDRPVSFLRDIQPVFDRHCVSCHSGLKPAGKLDFFAGLTSYDSAVPGYGYNRAYATILGCGLVACSPARAQDASITPPLAYGSHQSKLIQALGDRTHATAVHLSSDERLRLTMWIDANAPYHDGFVNKRAETPAYDLAADRPLRDRLAAIHQRRCSACHRADEVSRLDWIDIQHPERSVFLMAPLGRPAGGTGKCNPAVYLSQDDPDYRSARRLVEAAVQQAWAAPRRDLAALPPARSHTSP